MRFLHSAFLALCLLIAPAFVQAQDGVVPRAQERDIPVAVDAQEVMNSTFALYGQLGDERHFMCSATAFEKTPTGYHLITAGHCVTGDVPDGLKFFVAENIDSDLALQTVTVVKADFGRKYDFAVLNLNTTRSYKVVPIDDSQFPGIGEKVWNVNFSEGLTKQMSLGVVASGKMNDDAAEGQCGLCHGRYLVQLFDGPGASGSAVIDGDGKIVGLVEGGFPGKTLGAIVIPMTAYHEFIVDGTTDLPKDSAAAPSRQTSLIVVVIEPKRKHHRFLPW